MKLETGNIVELRGKKGVIIANPYEKTNCKLDVCFGILDKDGNVIDFINSLEDLEKIEKEITAHDTGIADKLK